jgi:4-oxalocrotonate tautomerase
LHQVSASLVTVVSVNLGTYARAKPKALISKTRHEVKEVLKIPFIEVSHLEGRTEEQRARLAEAITNAVSEIFEVPTEAVWIKFSEMPKDHFATGGKLASKK